jgi:proteic killer suppression protein
MEVPMLFRDRDGVPPLLYRETIQDTVMIIDFRHKGLERLYRSGSSSGIRHSHTSKVLMILSILDVASGPGDLAMPGLRLHKLRGSLKGHWSVWVNGNWRITFRFTGGDVELLDYLDYH